MTGKKGKGTALLCRESQGRRSGLWGIGRAVGAGAGLRCSSRAVGGGSSAGSCWTQASTVNCKHSKVLSFVPFFCSIRPRAAERPPSQAVAPAWLCRDGRGQSRLF